MASLSSMLGSIKSVQRGVFAGADTVTTINISPVNPAKAFVNVTSAYAVPGAYSPKYITLTSSTTLAAEHYDGSRILPIYWEVIEFY